MEASALPASSPKVAAPQPVVPAWPHWAVTYEPSVEEARYTFFLLFFVTNFHFQENSTLT